MSSLSLDEQKVADDLIEVYKIYASKNLARIKHNLRSEYNEILNEQQSRSSEFAFPEIMNKYRDSINPLLALHYEIKRWSWNYDPDDLYQQWLIDTVSDHFFHTKVTTALKEDIIVFKNIIKKYSILFEVDKEIPLELFHAKQRIKEFESCLDELSKVGGYE